MSGSPARAVETPERWTILEMIRWSADYLAGKGVDSGRLDAEHLLAGALGVERLALYLQFERPLTPEERAAYKPLLLRRAGREPLQYILGSTGFRELEVKTDGRALIPRPETELLVQEVLDWCGDDAGRTVLDVGTGTGVIALSLAKEGAFGRIVATDVSEDALALARENAEANGTGDVEFRAGDLFEAVGADETFDVIVSNPPYVEETARGTMEPEVLEWEPCGALFAGPDGLDVIERMRAQVVSRLRPGGLLALEVGAPHAGEVRDRIASTAGLEQTRLRRDLSGRPRIILANRA